MLVEKFRVFYGKIFSNDVSSIVEDYSYDLVRRREEGGPVADSIARTVRLVASGSLPQLILSVKR
jgi:hypothetical protein